jgi:hypothetical protein
MARMLRAVVVALLIVGALPAVALAARGMEVGINDDDVFVDHRYGPPDAAWGALAPLHVTRLRILVSQLAVEREGWSKYDAAVEDARARGLRVEMGLVGHYPRPDVASYEPFVADAAARFRGRVDRYDVWNEANYPSWLAAPRGQVPRIYRSLFIAASAAIRAADPTAQILIGPTSPYLSGGPGIPPVTFLRKVLCVDARLRHRRCPGLTADGFAHNPFDFTHGPDYRDPNPRVITIGTLDRLTRALDRFARIGALRTPKGQPLDVYLTEFGYFNRGRRAVSEARRARWLPQAFARAARNPRVRELVQYLLINPAGQPVFPTGLIEQDGTFDPAYWTLAKWAQRAARTRAIR